MGRIPFRAYMTGSPHIRVWEYTLPTRMMKPADPRLLWLFWDQFNFKNGEQARWLNIGCIGKRRYHLAALPTLLGVILNECLLIIHFYPLIPV